MRLEVYELRLSAACAGGFDCGPAGLHVAAGVVYLCALVGKQIGDRAAYASGACRHQGDFSF